jgi:hypothetical protein
MLVDYIHRNGVYNTWTPAAFYTGDEADVLIRYCQQSCRRQRRYGTETRHGRGGGARRYGTGGIGRRGDNTGRYGGEKLVRRMSRHHSWLGGFGLHAAVAAFAAAGRQHAKPGNILRILTINLRVFKETMEVYVQR